MPRFQALFRCQQPSVVETLIRNSRRNPLALPDVRAFAFSKHVASLALREIVQNRAIGPAVAMAGVDGEAQNTGHALQFCNAPVELLQMPGGDLAHVAAGAGPVAPER